uniref:Uncharacterized protein n=1 Tax=Anguilla anguilla TaxID=7936 RepID=A0A0E9X945_ANGAN
MDLHLYFNGYPPGVLRGTPNNRVKWLIVQLSF